MGDAHLAVWLGVCFLCLHFDAAVWVVGVGAFFGLGI